MTGRSALHRYAAASAVATFLLLIAGGLVTSTDSGLAVPDWPLSYGTWFPPMVGGIRYEHGHRMLAGIVGLMILALAVWLRRAEPRRWVRRLGYGALGAVFAQALLGGLTVVLMLPPAVSIAHACLGQTVFTLMTCLAACTSPRWDEQPSLVEARDVTRLQVLAPAVAGLAAVQLLVGAVIRHTGYGMHPHLAVAVLLLLAAGWLMQHLARLRRQLPGAWRLVLRVVGLLLLQAMLGGSVLMHRASVALRTGHVAVGALVLSQAVLLAWHVRRTTTGAPFPLARRPVAAEAGS